MLLAAVAMGSGYNEDTQAFNYAITTNATIGIMAALTVLTGLVNSMSTYWMEKMTKTYVIFHVLVLLSCSIALLVMTKSKHTASYVFAEVESTSGWNPVGFSFLFGFLSVSWTMTDYDATAHITEEISEPEVKAPWAISLAMLFTYVAGFLFNIVLCFCMGDPSAILASTLAQPVAQLFYNSLGPAGGIFYTVCGFIIIKFVCFTAMVRRPLPHTGRSSLIPAAASPGPDRLRLLPRPSPARLPHLDQDQPLHRHPALRGMDLRLLVHRHQPHRPRFLRGHRGCVQHLRHRLGLELLHPDLLQAGVWEV